MSQLFVRFSNSNDRDLAYRALLPFAPDREAPYRSRRDDRLLIAALRDDERQAARQRGAEIYEDLQFSITRDPLFEAEDAYWSPAVAPAPAPTGALRSHRDVMAKINAPQAQGLATGEGIAIAIMDTGIVTRAEFGARCSADSKAYKYGTPWDDTVGHGTMCAGIAAGSSPLLGFDGVAPAATLISMRTNFAGSDIYKLYEDLLDLHDHGTVMVINNSYGLRMCQELYQLDRSHPYVSIVQSAVDDRIPVVFAAGNNHWNELCNHDETACEPSTIWAVNSIDDVITVGAVDDQDRNDNGIHANSSRGPGQWSGSGEKPDVVAPCYGETYWGGGFKTMAWWGTSGACAQVSGLVALLLQRNPALSPAQIKSIIRNTASNGAGPHTNCIGRGTIDCLAAVNSALAPPP